MNQSEDIFSIQREEKKKLHKKILDKYPNFPCKMTETEEQVCVTRESALKAMLEAAEEEHDYYCPTCDSCGHEGCCSPLNCKKIQCDYGETYAADYKFAIEFAEETYKLLGDNEKVNKLRHDLYAKHYKS